MDKSLKKPVDTNTKECSPHISSNRKKMMHTAIGLALMFLFPLLPPLEPITQVGMTLIGVFVGMVYLWSTVDSKWPSLLGLIIVGLSDYATVNEVILGSFGDSMIITCALAMILFGAIDHYGSSRYIARWFITRPIINGKPYIFITLLLLCGYTLSALTDPIPSVLVTWAIGIEILDSLDIKKTDDVFPVILLATFFGVCLGQPVLPFKGASLMVIAAFQEMTGIGVSFFPYIFFNVILNVLCILMFLGLTKFLFKPDVSKLKNINTEEINANPLPPMNQRQKGLLWSVVVFITLMLIPAILPATVPGITILNNLGVAGVTFITIIALCVIHTDDGKPVLEFNEVAKTRFSWDVYLLLAAAIYIAKAISSDASGVNAWLINFLSPLLSGRSDYIFAILVMVVVLIMTNIANNAGMVLILLPVIVAFSQQAGINPLPFSVLVMTIAFIGMLTPSASPHSCIVHGRSDLLDLSDIYRIGIPLTIGTLAIYVVFGIPLSKLLFG